MVIWVTHMVIRVTLAVVVVVVSTYPTLLGALDPVAIGSGLAESSTVKTQQLVAQVTNLAEASLSAF